jgi:hypothetical protein
LRGIKNNFLPNGLVAKLLHVARYDLR